MSEKINPLVVDLSHWDPASNYDDVAANGIVGVIYKATQGTGNTDDTYVDQQRAAKAAGLKWGCYHFADGSNVDAQVSNFMNFACPDPDELFCLDWEDNSGNAMTSDMAKAWITKVEDALGRPGECVIYSGNTAKEQISGNDPFFGARRLWLCQYGSTPTVQASWKTYWLWQFTDGNNGPSPHTVGGIGSCDISSYNGSAVDLAAQWASGTAQPKPPPTPTPEEVATLHLDIQTTGHIEVSIAVNGEVIYGEES